MVTWVNLSEKNVLPPPAGIGLGALTSAWPIAEGNITGRYGQRAGYKKYPQYASGYKAGEGHGGLDIVVVPGESKEVICPASGDIYDVYHSDVDGEGIADSGFGHSVCIDHGFGPDGVRYYSSYSHLAQYPSHLKKGDPIGAGDFIGIVGATGGDYGEHLHWGLGSTPFQAYRRARNVTDGTGLASPRTTDDVTFNPIHPDFLIGGSQQTIVPLTVNQIISEVNRNHSLFAPQSPINESGGLRARNFSLILPAPSGVGVEINQEYKITFTISEGTDSQSPGSIKIYNLSGATEHFIGRGAQTYIVFAGYGPYRKRISSGLIGKINRKWEPPNRVTEIILGPHASTKGTHLFHTFRGQSPAEIFNTLARYIGIDEEQNFNHIPNLYRDSFDFAVNGSVEEAIGRLAGYYHLDFALTGGRLRLMRTEGSVSLSGDSTIYRINYRNGMIGIPTYVSGGGQGDGDTALRVNTVLNPDLAIGGYVRVQSRLNSVDEIDEVIQITSLKHTGDTRGDIFRTEVTGTLMRVDASPTPIADVPEVEALDDIDQNTVSDAFALQGGN